MKGGGVAQWIFAVPLFVYPTVEEKAAWAENGKNIHTGIWVLLRLKQENEFEESLQPQNITENDISGSCLLLPLEKLEALRDIWYVYMYVPIRQKDVFLRQTTGITTYIPNGRWTEQGQGGGPWGFKKLIIR